jgi:hypothetical protein
VSTGSSSFDQLDQEIIELVEFPEPPTSTYIPLNTEEVREILIEFALGRLEGSWTQPPTFFGTQEQPIDLSNDQENQPPEVSAATTLLEIQGGRSPQDSIVIDSEGDADGESDVQEIPSPIYVTPTPIRHHPYARATTGNHPPRARTKNIIRGPFSFADSYQTDYDNHRREVEAVAQAERYIEHNGLWLAQEFDREEVALNNHRPWKRGVRESLSGKRYEGKLFYWAYLTELQELNDRYLKVAHDIRLQQEVAENLRENEGFDSRRFNRDLLHVNQSEGSDREDIISTQKEIRRKNSHGLFDI